MKNQVIFNPLVIYNNEMITRLFVGWTPYHATLTNLLAEKIRSLRLFNYHLWIPPTIIL